MSGASAPDENGAGLPRFSVRTLLPWELARWVWARPFLRFLIVGGLNTLFGYGVFALFIVIGLHYAVAALLGTILGILFNFKTYGTLVFASRDNRLIGRFFGVYAITYVIAIGVLKLFKYLGVHVLVTSAAMTLPMAYLSYQLNRRWVFGRAPRAPDAAPGGP